uniref:2-CB domain n=1 Tax=Argas monolakensis TaxID=34602 RepID=Q09JT9_ARGMO|nr:2-CB domain [Argas monolakensis]
MKFITLCFLVALMACAMCAVVEGGRFLRSPGDIPAWVFRAREARPCTVMPFPPFSCV